MHCTSEIVSVAVLVCELGKLSDCKGTSTLRRLPDHQHPAQGTACKIEKRLNTVSAFRKVELHPQIAAATFTLT